jgi:RNA polymerase sigma-70 factor (ECF subfamily)
MEIEGFKELFDRHYKPVRNFLYYKLGDMPLAEDLTQEVFLKVWEKRATILPDSVQSLLFTIANHLALNHFNSAKARFEFRHRGEEKPGTENPESVMEQKEFEERLKSALARLPENQRVVFLMNRIDELTYREIAERLGLGVKAVEKRMSEALEFLREHVTRTTG